MGNYALFRPRDRENNFILSVAMTTVKMLFFVVLLIGVAALGLGIGVGKAWVDTSPMLDLDVLHSQSQTSFIYDKYGELITEYKGSENRIYVELDEVPQNLIDAVVSIEDARFWEHNGIDIKRIGGAFISTFFRGDTQGGSTITCQLIKLTLLTSDQNFRRKVQEAYLALQLEDAISKEEILEEYLNVIYLGGSSYGVCIAAQDYFGKDLEQLTLRECATLAGMIRNPSRYNPRSNYYSRNTPEVTDDRADYVLELMYEQGYITEDEYQHAMNEQLTVLEKGTAASNEMYDNAYYVEYAIYDVVTKMLRVEGDLEDNSTNRAAMQRQLRTGGYRVYTSLDPRRAGSGAAGDHRMGRLPGHALFQRPHHAGLSGRRRISHRGAAAGRRRGDELPHGRTGGHRRRARGAGAKAAIQPRLPEQHAHRLVHQAALRLWPGL